MDFYRDQLAAFVLEIEMPAKPKSTTVKPSAPNAKPSLYKAIRERLEAKDRETLHARTQKAVKAVEALPEIGVQGVHPVEAVNVTNIVNQAAPAPAVPWSLGGLVVDPGEEAVGQWGWFWDVKGGGLWFDELATSTRSGEFIYAALDGSIFRHFAYIPNFPGAELLKRTTGYDAGIELDVRRMEKERKEATA